MRASCVSCFVLSDEDTELYEHWEDMQSRLRGFRDVS